MKITPLFDRVLLKPDGDQFGRTSTGIILGSSSSDAPVFATVIACGNGKVEAGENLEMQVKIGDKVIYNKFAGTEILLDSVTHVIIKQTDILGIIE
ncbi:MAG: co-chaperone GroES [Clostridia bacterium]|nr:co-chaperone GroES [Clostridia bacterium]